MTDPFDALREPVTPVDPDPDFARRLRLQLRREIFASPGNLASPQNTGDLGNSGGTMSQQTPATQVEHQPAWPPALTPYIVVSDTRRAIDWYVEVFGAERRGEAGLGIDRCDGLAQGLERIRHREPSSAS